MRVGWGENIILLITITSVLPYILLVIFIRKETLSFLQKCLAEAVGMLKFKILGKFYNLFMISLSSLTSPKFLAIFSPGALQGECI